MKVVKVHDAGEYVTIECDNGSVYMQRKGPRTASDNALEFHERLILALSACALTEALQSDVSADKTYINGAIFGWNCGVAGDRETFQSAIAGREAEIEAVRSPRGKQ